MNKSDKHECESDWHRWRDDPEGQRAGVSFETWRAYMAERRAKELDRTAEGTVSAMRRAPCAGRRISRKQRRYQVVRGLITRTPKTLDDALYSASCYAASAEDGSRTVTILAAIDDENNEHYRVEDGRVSPRRGDATGLDWTVAYYVEAGQE
ncbi:MAG: hypothetical protein ACE5I3_13645 [Phycisphaerae bacterium]